MAEGTLAVGLADRQEPAGRRLEAFQVAIVGEGPVLAPQAAHEWMAVLRHHRALGRLADMGDDVLRLDRVTLDALGNRRGNRWQVIGEQLADRILVERDAPAILVLVGAATTGRKALERKTDRGRGVAVHSQ